jgi:hypothetical protein
MLWWQGITNYSRHRRLGPDIELLSGRYLAEDRSRMHGNKAVPGIKVGRAPQV